MKRKFTSLTICPQDLSLYAGTRQGDIIECLLLRGTYKRIGAVRKIQSPVTEICAKFSNLFIAYQNGQISKVEKQNLQFIDEHDIGNGPIIAFANSGEKVYSLTAGGSLHSTVAEKSPLNQTSCFMTSITQKVK